jgi:glycosyltransferase involved in cell wall biosynthesis
MILSVIIPTHSPRADILRRTLDALRAQSLETAAWELVLVDNCSQPPLETSLVSWHPHGRVVRAETLGLTAARIAGHQAACGELLVWVDDDNVLASDYLHRAAELFASRPSLGAAGGRSLPDYETPPPEWYSPDLAPIGCRDLGDAFMESRWSANTPRDYPECSPIGAGMIVRRTAMETWINQLQTSPERRLFGRTGAALTSGEDNDIVLTLLGAGWSVAYEPRLVLTHVIPPRRLTLDYQRRIAHATFRDFIRVLALHGIRPWSPVRGWTVPLRKLKAWFALRAWSGPVASIRWHDACGQIEGRARISHF